MKRPILMTGASGFIGYNVVARLEAAGETVVSLGRTAPKQPGIEHVPMELSGGEMEARAVVERIRPRAILFLASAPPVASDDQHESVTLGAALRLLCAARRIDGCRFVAIGSAAEFGAAVSSPYLVENAPRAPLSAYGRAKASLMDAIAERAVRGDDVLGLRLFAAIGPDMPAHSLLGSVVRQLRDAGRTVVETGCLDGERDYLPVAQVAMLMTSLALAPTRLPPWLNIGSGQGVALRNLVDTTIRLSGRDLECWEKRGSPTSAGLRFVADTTQLRSIGHVIVAPTIDELAALALGEGGRHSTLSNRTD